MQDAMHPHIAIQDTKVDAVIPSTAAVETLSTTLEYAVAFAQNGIVHIRRLDIESLQEVKLRLRGQLGELGGADVVEDDLDHAGKRTVRG